MNNVNTLRKLIRSLIQEINTTNHFEARVKMRLDGPNETTDFPGAFPKFKDRVMNVIDFLKNKINFDDEVKAAIYLKCPQYYKALDSTKFGEYTHGNQIMFIIRENTILTMFFDRSRNLRKDYGHVIPFEKLEKYSIENNINFFTEKEIKKMFQPTTVSVEKPKEIIFIIDGKKWVFDRKEEKLYNRNNPKNSFNIYDVLDDKIENVKLKQREKDEILSYLL